MRGHDLPRKEKKRNKVLLLPSCSSIQTREQSYGENLFLPTKLLSKGEMNITKDDFLRIARSTIEIFSPIFLGGVKGLRKGWFRKERRENSIERTMGARCISVYLSSLRRCLSGSV